MLACNSLLLLFDGPEQTGSAWRGLGKPCRGRIYGTVPKRLKGPRLHKAVVSGGSNPPGAASPRGQKNSRLLRVGDRGGVRSSVCQNRKEEVLPVKK